MKASAKAQAKLEAVSEFPQFKQVTVHEAKTNLSRLLKAVEDGESVVIARRGVPVARLVPLQPKPRRQFGRYRGLFELGPAFFEPLPENELKAWDGE